MTEFHSENKSFIFAGGGTGGHLFPGIAVADQLASQSDCRIVFVGSNRPVEQQIIERAGYEHLRLPSSSTSDLKRASFRFVWNNSRAFLQARRFLRKEKPAVVVGLGGFASVPVVVAASRLKIPIVLLEQNTIAGRANQFLFSRSNLICTSFSETFWGKVRTATSGGPRIVFTGNPVRNEMQAASSRNAPVGSSEKTVVLVLGGSQGASAINDTVLSLLKEASEEFLEKLHLVHQTGVSDFSNVDETYQAMKKNSPGFQVTVQPFFEDLAKWYSEADFAISRAGATTLAELACGGCPAVLIPYPNSIGDHQLINARFYEDHGAAVLVNQAQDSSSTAKKLGEVTLNLTQDRDQLSQMRQAMLELALPCAARDVADQVSMLIQ